MPKQQVFYAVGVGLKTGVFTSWYHSIKLVKGFRNGKFKKFKTKSEAWAFVKSYEAAGKAKKRKKPPMPAKKPPMPAKKPPMPAKKPPSPAKKPPSPPKKPPQPRMMTRSQKLALDKRKQSLRYKSSVVKQPQNFQPTTKPEPPVPPTQKNPKISSAKQSHQMGSNEKGLNVQLKRPATTINTPTQKRARINSGEDHGLQRPLHIFFDDDFAASEKAPGLKPPHHEKEKPEGNTELTELKEELERLKEKQAKMESEILKIVQHIQEKTDGMEILKAEIAVVERRVATIEAGKPSSLQEAVSRIRKYKEPEPRKEPKVKKPESKAEQPEPALQMRAEGFVDEEISDCEILENEKFEVVKRNDHCKYNFDRDGFCNVYTDGLCLYNRISGPRAGMGVFFGDENNYNMSEPLTGCQPTNHNAAIQAAALACNVAKLTGITMINIHLDSKFVMSCVKDVMPTWETRDALPEENEAQLLLLKDAMEGLNVRWTFVEPKSTVHGSMMARKLAKEGAEKQ